MKKILLADSHFVVRAGTSLIIEKSYSGFLVDEVENYHELIKKIQNNSYDLLFLDISMLGTRYELMINDIKDIDKNIKILIFSACEESIAVKYLTEGADGYLNKLSSKEKLIEAIDCIFKDGFYYSPQIMKEMFLINQKKKKNPFHNLTQKEKEIVRLLITGNGNLEISNLMNIQMSTISTYKKKIYNKLQVNNVIELFTLHETFKE